MTVANPVHAHVVSKIHIEHNYTCSATDEIALPDGIKFADIRLWYIKWQCFHFTVDGENWQSIDMHSDIEVNDTKRPSGVIIYSQADDGMTNYTDILAQE